MDGYKSRNTTYDFNLQLNTCHSSIGASFNLCAQRPQLILNISTTSAPPLTFAILGFVQHGYCLVGSQTPDPVPPLPSAVLDVFLTCLSTHRPLFLHHVFAPPPLLPRTPYSFHSHVFNLSWKPSQLHIPSRGYGLRPADIVSVTPHYHVLSHIHLPSFFCLTTMEVTISV
eukprot:3835063-Amphidinium_carterae.2